MDKNTEVLPYLFGAREVFEQNPRIGHILHFHQNEGFYHM